MKIGVHDVAAYILENQGEMTTMKLQKLVYYSQAWSLVWDERPLFEDPIEAWIGGPIVPVLYSKHKGEFRVEAWPEGDASALDEDARETVDSVLRFYGPMSGQELSDLTHAEQPWRDARVGLEPNVRGNHEISKGALYEYYESLSPENSAPIPIALAA